MTSEISSWKLVVNALFFLPDRVSMSLDPDNKRYFWKYLLIAAERLENDFPDLRLYTDKYSLENVLYNDNLYIRRDTKENSIYLDEGITEKDMEDVNEYISSVIKIRFPEVFRDAFLSSCGLTIKPDDKKIPVIPGLARYFGEAENG